MNRHQLKLGREEEEGVKIQMLSNLQGTQLTLQTMKDVQAWVYSLPTIGTPDPRGKIFTLEFSACGPYNSFREKVSFPIGHFKEVGGAVKRAQYLINTFASFSLGAIESILEKHNDRSEFRWFRESVTNDLKALSQLSHLHDFQFLRIATSLGTKATPKDWNESFERYFNPLHRPVMMAILEHYKSQDALLIGSTSRSYGNNVFELNLQLVVGAPIGENYTRVSLTYLHTTIDPEAFEKICGQTYPRGA